MFQLSFLNTGLLIFAAATVIPLLIWLLAKKKPPRIIFSTIKFIVMSKDKQQSRTRLKNILLLIIRMLIILLVVMAAARPILRSSRLKPSAQHPPTALAVILDTSYSMDYLVDTKSYLQKAKEAIRQINSRATAQDRLILITANQDWNTRYSQIYAGTLSEDLIEDIQACFTPLPLEKMLELAEAKLADSQLQNRELYFITDMQERELPEKTGYPIHLIPLGATGSWENIVCLNARPVAQLVERNRTQLIEFELVNFGTSARNDVLIKAELNGSKVAEKFVSLEPRQRLTETIAVEIRSDGWQRGFIEVLDDRLIHDNRSYFAFPFFINPRIAVITDQNRLPLTLDSMLSVYTTDKGTTDIVSPEAVNADRLKQYNLIVCVAPVAMSTRLRETLSTISAQGRGILYVVNDALSAEWKNYLGNQFGIGFGEYQGRETNLDFVNRQHYITSLIDQRQAAQFTVSDYWETRLTDQGSVLLSSANRPLALVKGKSALWLFNMESRRNRFFLSAVFPVFAFRTLQYIGKTETDVTGITVGGRITAETLQYPDGTVMTLANRIHTTTQPGIYETTASDGTTGYVAVNPDHAESDFRPLDLSQHKQFQILPPDWQDHIFQSRLGRDLWKILLLAALVLIIIELILVKLEEGKAGKPETPSEG